MKRIPCIAAGVMAFILWPALLLLAFLGVLAIASVCAEFFKSHHSVGVWVMTGVCLILAACFWIGFGLDAYCWVYKRCNAQGKTANADKT